MHSPVALARSANHRRPTPSNALGNLSCSSRTARVLQLISVAKNYVLSNGRDSLGKLALQRHYACREVQLKAS
eukprot:4979689-Pleurochrysis_carterae.AAC.5